MAQKITRKDLKRNEIAETVGRTMDYVTGHRRGVVESIAIAAAVALLVAAFFLVRGYRESQAGRELSAGLTALDTPVAGSPAALNAPKTYATEGEREREARSHLERAAGIRGTEAGRAAAVILAAREPAAASSSETLSRAARDAKAEVAAAAELDEARLLASKGKTSEAIDRLKRAIESPRSSAPKDALLFALAEIYEKSGAPADARATYQRLVNDYPNSPYRQDARQKLPSPS
jgi:tetratricopeptide (TPR) repeat protein